MVKHCGDSVTVDPVNTVKCLTGTENCLRVTTDQENGLCTNYMYGCGIKQDNDTGCTKYENYGLVIKNIATNCI